MEFKKIKLQTWYSSGRNFLFYPFFIHNNYINALCVVNDGTEHKGNLNVFTNGTIKETGSYTSFSERDFEEDT
jgi:hypothetical protein